MVAVCDDALIVAVRVAVVDDVIEPAVAVNLPVVAPEAMLIEVGTVSDVLLLDNVTVTPTVGAA